MPAGPDLARRRWWWPGSGRSYRSSSRQTRH